MTHIDFYILSDSASEARWHFACRLVDKALRLGHSVLVAMNNRAEAEALDQLLWTFKPESFIPHQCLSDENTKSAPVEITYGSSTAQLPGHHQDLLINLSHAVPAYFSQFKRLSEVVIQAPEVLENTREHFSFYRERGYPIQHRKI